MARSEEEIKTIPEMMASRRAAGSGAECLEVGARIKTESIPDLIRRIGFEQDPFRLWMAHLMLDHLGVPPCLRWPERDDSEQMLFITWLADVFWFMRRRPTSHKIRITKWRGLLGETGEKWHKTARWVFRMGHDVGHFHSHGLGLSNADRQPLMVMVTQQARSDRGVLRRLPAIREALLLHALDHPDRSGRHDAESIADRRAELLRLYLLAGRNQTRAIAYLELLSGVHMTRQAFEQQLQLIEAVTGIGRTRSQRAGRQRPSSRSSEARSPRRLTGEIHVEHL